MAKYYNKSQVALAVTLRSGKSSFLAGKAWTEISAAEEGSEDVIRAVRRGLILRSDIGAADAALVPAPAVPAVPAVPAAPASEPVAPKEVVSEVKFSGEPPPVLETPPLELPVEEAVNEKTSDNLLRRRKG